MDLQLFEEPSLVLDGSLISQQMHVPRVRYSS